MSTFLRKNPSTILNAHSRALVDDFKRSDGIIHGTNGWIDAYTLYPASFNQAAIVSNQLDCTGTVMSTWVSDQSWTRSGTTCTVTCNYHELANGSTINVKASSAPSTVSLGAKTITVPNNNTLTFTCANTGPTSGTIQFNESNKFQVGHTLVVRELGPIDDFFVTVRWDTTDSYSYFSQVQPVGFVKLDADYLSMGCKPVWDVGIGSTYWQNEFRSASLYDVLDPPTYYRTIAGTGVAFSGPTTGPGTSHEYTMRVKDGYMVAYWDGKRRNINPVPVPSYCLDGRTNFVGISVVSINVAVGKNVGFGPVVTMARDRITGFWAGEFTGSLTGGGSDVV